MEPKLKRPRRYNPLSIPGQSFRFLLFMVRGRLRFFARTMLEVWLMVERTALSPCVGRPTHTRPLSDGDKWCIHPARHNLTLSSSTFNYTASISCRIRTVFGTPTRELTLQIALMNIQRRKEVYRGVFSSQRGAPFH